MAVGNTTTDALRDSLPSMIAEARSVREYDGVMPQLVERHTLEEGTGLTWNEVVYAQLNAQAITEQTVLDNPQQLSDTNFPLTPTQVGLQTLITDRVGRRITKNGLRKTSGLAQQAMERKKDEDGLTLLDSGTSLSGAGTTLVSGVIAAASVRITGNTTEPFTLPIRCVLHPFQVKDIWDEIVAGVGTYPIPEGETARVFKEGMKGKISSAEIYEDGNITIDGSSDAKGGVFSKMAVVLVQGYAPRMEVRREPHIGGGANSVFHYDEYIFGERLGAGATSVGLFEIYTNATAPTG